VALQLRFCTCSRNTIEGSIHSMDLVVGSNFDSSWCVLRPSTWCCDKRWQASLMMMLWPTVQRLDLRQVKDGLLLGGRHPGVPNPHQHRVHNCLSGSRTSGSSRRESGRNLCMPCTDSGQRTQSLRMPFASLTDC